MTEVAKDVVQRIRQDITRLVYSTKFLVKNSQVLFPCTMCKSCSSVAKKLFLAKARNVSIGHRCPRFSTLVTKFSDRQTSAKWGHKFFFIGNQEISYSKILQ